MRCTCDAHLLLQGLPYVEPGFGTIEESRPGDRHDVHGVVHLIRQDQWERVKLSEGVNAQHRAG